MKLITELERLHLVLKQNQIKDDIEILLPREAMQRLLLEMSECQRIPDGTSSRNIKLFDQIVISHKQDKDDRIFELADYAAHRTAIMLSQAMIEMDKDEKKLACDNLYHSLRREFREGFLEGKK